MSHIPEPQIRVRVDPTNPGQFFACCGLLELADRLWHGAEGWFGRGMFYLKTDENTASLFDLLNVAKHISLADNGNESVQESDEDEEDEATPIIITAPVTLCLDWWGDKSLKTWAGSMNKRKIFVAMCNAIDPQDDNPLNQGVVVFDADTSLPETVRRKRSKKPKKREPFYFDARRGASAWSIDAGFSTDSLKLNTVAYPVVEAMCLIGLQRCRPKPTDTSRVFDYFTWDTPLSLSVAPVATFGLIGHGNGFRFKNDFRTTRIMHKAFNPATPINRS